MTAGPPDGFYFMFEIGWFIDLLIPTLVRVIDGKLHLIGSAAAGCKNIKPCCAPCGGAAELKKLSPDDPALKGFNVTASLIPVAGAGNPADELRKVLADREIRAAYLNCTSKVQREATEDRVLNDYRVLAEIA